MKTVIFTDTNPEQHVDPPEHPRGLWDLMGRPMLSYALDLGAAFSDRTPVVLTGREPSSFRSAFPERSIDWRQVPETGTIDPWRDLPDSTDLEPSEHVLLLRGDTPLIRAGHLEGLREHHQRTDAALTLLSGPAEEGFVCTVERDTGEVGSVETEANEDEDRDVAHATDVGVIRADALRDVVVDEPREDGEDGFNRPLREVARQLVESGHRVERYAGNDPADAVRIRTPEALAEATDRLRKRVISMLMDQGVKVLSPAQTYIEPDVQIGEGTVIEPFVVIRNGVEIGTNCHVGPFSQIREGTILEDRAEIGNYVETKNSRVGEGTKAKHLSYLGDATIGDDVNIGAGTITANYDGTNKHRTTIEDHASTGSNTVLVAPVTMKEGSKTGAGAVVTRGQDVEKGDTVVGVPARRLDES